MKRVICRASHYVGCEKLAQTRRGVEFLRIRAPGGCFFFFFFAKFTRKMF